MYEGRCSRSAANSLANDFEKMRIDAAARLSTAIVVAHTTPTFTCVLPHSAKAATPAEKKIKKRTYKKVALAIRVIEASDGRREKLTDLLQQMICAIGAQQYLGVGPVGPDRPQQAAQEGANLLATRPFGGAKHSRDEAGFAVAGNRIRS